MASRTMPAELVDPLFLSTRTLAVGWFMAWRLAGAILLPGSAVTALALAGSSASTLVSSTLIGWYCALTILIAACLATNYFAGRWAEREYDRGLPDNIWWGVVWRTGLVALPFPPLAIAALTTSPVLHGWAWALAGVSGATGLFGSLFMLGWSTAHMVHRSLRAPAQGPAEEPTGWFRDFPVPTVPPSRRPAKPKATGAPHAIPATGQSPVSSPAMGVAHPTPVRPHDLSDAGHPTPPAGPPPEPQLHPQAPEPISREWSPAAQDPRPSPVPEEIPFLTAAPDPSPSAHPQDAPSSDPVSLWPEAQPLPPDLEPVPNGLSPATRPTPLAEGEFQARYWQNIAGGWEVEISYGAADEAEDKRGVVFRSDRRPRPMGAPPGGFYSREMAEELAKAKIEEGREILAINQRVRRAPRYRIPEGLSATLDPLGKADLQDLSLLGACAEHERPLTPGQEVRLALDLPGRRVCASAQVVWSAHAAGTSVGGGPPARFRSGLRFLAVHPEDLLDLQEYLGGA